MSLMRPWPRQNVSNPYTNARLPEVRLERGAPMRPIFHFKVHYFRPWRAQNHASLLENVHLGHMPPPMGDFGGPNPSVILTIFIHPWHKTMLFLWKTHTWAIWAPHGRHWWSKLSYTSQYKRRLPRFCCFRNQFCSPRGHF